MEIVSIKKFLRPQQPRPESYIRFLQLLLDGISVHAVEANEIELTRFRQEVSNISETLSVRSTAEEIEAALGFVIRAVTGYNRMAARITRAHVNELQAMLKMMSKTIAFLSHSSKTGIEQLQNIEKNLQRASTIGDVRLLRGKLNDCLGLVRSESIRLRDETEARIGELQVEVQRTSDHVRAAGITLEEEVPAPAQESRRAVPQDHPVEGRKGRDAAEALIADRISRGRDVVVTLFVVDRFGVINGRFGSELCGGVLAQVNEYLDQQLEAGTLFKWSGPAFAAVTNISEPREAIEQQMMRIASKRFEKTIEEDRRMVLVPITLSAIVRKVTDSDSLNDLASTLDDFVAVKAY